MKYILIGAMSVALLAACGKDETAKKPAPPPAPVVQEAPAPAPLPVEEAPAVPEKPSVYVVVKGDTLYSIARAHDVSPADLVRWNNIDNPDLIGVGQELKVTGPDQ